MSESEFRISGTGCALVDYLYNPVQFNSPDFLKYLSEKPGDGGLAPGKLVFTEEFEKFSGEEYAGVRDRLTDGKKPLTINIGGPSIVSLIHASQMLHDSPAGVFFHGCRGRDEGGSFIEKTLGKTPLRIGKYKLVNRYTPFTDVLCDPEYDGGERIFLNNIGAAWEMYPADLDDAFFHSDINVFGGTALVPNIHSSLESLLEKSKGNGAVTIVNTVYDFLSEKKDPSGPWKMGESEDTYKHIDLLIADMEESLRLSGGNSAGEALKYFKAAGVGSVVITHGANDIFFYCDNELFGTIAEGSLPVSEKVKSDLLSRQPETGDTTGCGDNFAGGIIASVAEQMINKKTRKIDLLRAVAFGVVSGGFTCFYHGGTYHEEFPGQKLKIITQYLDAYTKQIGL